jgi:glyoxylase I family protein
MKVASLHHVALPCTDLERSRRFYREILGLQEIPRPNFPFPGAWFDIDGQQQLHLIVYPGQTFRESGLETRDVHFAVRTSSFRELVEYLRSKGYREDAEDEMARVIVNPRATAGFPQTYILDPDRNVIEINTASLD